VVDLIDLEENRLGDVVADEFESAAVEELLVAVLEVFPTAGEVIVEADDVAAFVEEA
jgi:hypothetical protein